MPHQCGGVRRARRPSACSSMAKTLAGVSRPAQAAEAVDKAGGLQLTSIQSAPVREATLPLLLQPGRGARIRQYVGNPRPRAMCPCRGARGHPARCDRALPSARCDSQEPRTASRFEAHDGVHGRRDHMQERRPCCGPPRLARRREADHAVMATCGRASTIAVRSAAVDLQLVAVVLFWQTVGKLRTARAHLHPDDLWRALRSSRALCQASMRTPPCPSPPRPA